MKNLFNYLVFDVICDFFNDLRVSLKHDNRVMDSDYRKLLDKGVDPLKTDDFYKLED